MGELIIVKEFLNRPQELIVIKISALQCVYDSCVINRDIALGHTMELLAAKNHDTVMDYILDTEKVSNEEKKLILNLSERIVSDLAVKDFISAILEGKIK